MMPTAIIYKFYLKATKSPKRIRLSQIKNCYVKSVKIYTNYKKTHLHTQECIKETLSENCRKTFITDIEKHHNIKGKEKCIKLKKLGLNVL